MRKEVKLGMAIGGGLIAVLVVYLLVTPPANKNGAQLANGGGGGSIIDVTQPGESAAAAVDDKGAVKAGADAAGQLASGNTAAGDVQLPPTREAVKERAAAKEGERATGAGDPWGRALQEGKTDRQPASGTPSPRTAPVKEREPVKPAAPARHDVLAVATPAAGNSEPKLYFNPNDAWGGGISTDAVLGGGSPAHRASKATAHATPASPAAAPVVGGNAKGETHVVQSGDTLSSIAMEAYGSASYYPHILRANPTVNPNNLKLGTVLTLPKVDEVKVTSSSPAVGERSTGVAASVVQQDVKIDPTHQYQVQSGDSLYKISLKVYGKSTFVEKIYEKNKGAIGSDPKKLKLGMILELPEKTTLAAATPSQETGSEASSENDRR